MRLVVIYREFLWIAPVLVVSAMIAWRYSALILPVRAKKVIGLLRSLGIVALCLCLADVKIVRDGGKVERRHVVFVADVSESIPERRRSMAFKKIVSSAAVLGAGDGVDVRVLLFNRKNLMAAEDEAPEESVLEDCARELQSSSGGTETAAALRRAIGACSDGASCDIILLSDGRDTGGGLEAVAELARSMNVRIHCLPLEARPPDDLMIESFVLPEKVFAMEKFPIEVFVRSRKPGIVRIRLFRDGTPLANENIRVEKGLTRWTYESREETVGLRRYSVRIEGVTVPDTYLENDYQVGAVKIEIVPRILIVTDDDASIFLFAKSLTDAGIRHKIIPDKDFPSGLPGLLQYSAVVFDNVSADELRQDQLKMIRTYVEDYGGGFLMTGGKRSFGMGGYYDTPVEEVLPVSMSPQSYSASFGVILLLDASSSMRGFPIQWVKRAAKQIIWLMRGKNLGVYFFNTLPFVAVQLQRVGQNRILVERDIDSIRAFGGTAFSPALIQACKALDQAGFANKHIILLSDGNPADVVLVKRLYPTIRYAQIKVSTIGVGKQVNNAILREIASQCDGRFYQAREINKIPEIFEEEVKRIIGPPYVEEPFTPVPRAGSEFVKGIGPRELPTLLGYVGTTPKDRAILDVLSPRDDVILAHWRYGLGRTAAFTSDVKDGGWGRHWAAWKGASRFWGRIVKSLLRTHLSDYELNVSVKGRKARLAVDAVDTRGRYINGAELEVRVRPPSGKALEPFILRQVAEGRYEGAVHLDEKGFYAIDVFRKGQDDSSGDGGMKAVASSVAALGYSPEYRFGPTNEGLLSALAAGTGGTLLHDLEDLPAAGIGAGRSNADLSGAWNCWPLFLLLSFLVYVAEITIRRLGLVEDSGSHSSGGRDLSYKRIADQYLRLAKKFDRKGDEKQAQDYYLKARSFYLKARHSDQAARMWERYRYLERRHP